MAADQHAIDVQINVRVIRQPKNGRPLTDQIIRAAILHRADEGEDAPGFECRIIRWRHTHRKGARWINAADEDSAWDSFRRWLQFGSVHIKSSLRKG